MFTGFSKFPSGFLYMCLKTECVKKAGLYLLCGIQKIKAYLTMVWTDLSVTRETPVLGPR